MVHLLHHQARGALSPAVQTAQEIDFFFPSCYFLSIKIMQTQQVQQLLCEASEMSNHSFPK